MTRRFAFGMMCGVLVFGAALVASAPSGGAATSAQTPAKNPPDTVPAHHTAAPTAPLPDTLDPAQFSDVITKNSYAMAARLKNVLYQQPCYCFCDHNNGHHSLYDCFVTAHAATCNICKMEAIFAYEQTRKGETATAIRKEIVRGDWKSIDPQKYATLKDVR
jgi:hypothetical protein